VTVDVPASFRPWSAAVVAVPLDARAGNNVRLLRRLIRWVPPVVLLSMVVLFASAAGFMVAGWSGAVEDGSSLYLLLTLLAVLMGPLVLIPAAVATARGIPRVASGWLLIPNSQPEAARQLAALNPPDVVRIG
jgi:hypothetical protein